VAQAATGLNRVASPIEVVWDAPPRGFFFISGTAYRLIEYAQPRTRKAQMRIVTRRATATLVLALPSGMLFAQSMKTYKHAPQYQLAILDQNLRVATGSDLTLGKTQTDAKLSPGGQGIHLLHTDEGDYRVEAPVNSGATFLSALGSNAYHPAQTIHNKWFLDNVQSGTKVLFASECAKPNKKHPNDVVRCRFYFPDPDSGTHEYETLGDFTPYTAGDGSNTQKTANTLCGTGKLRPEVEAQLCGAPAPAAKRN
jgi:hypothetical protein